MKEYSCQRHIHADNVKKIVDFNSSSVFLILRIYFSYVDITVFFQLLDLSSAFLATSNNLDKGIMGVIEQKHLSTPAKFMKNFNDEK